MVVRPVLGEQEVQEDFLNFRISFSDCGGWRSRGRKLQGFADLLVEGLQATGVAGHEHLRGLIHRPPDGFGVRTFASPKLGRAFASRLAISAMALRLFISATSLPSGMTACRASSNRNRRSVVERHLLEPPAQAGLVDDEAILLDQFVNGCAP